MTEALNNVKQDTKGEKEWDLKNKKIDTNWGNKNCKKIKMLLNSQDMLDKTVLSLEEWLLNVWDCQNTPELSWETLPHVGSSKGEFSTMETGEP